MAEENKRNIQIPEEAIEGPAGKDDVDATISYFSLNVAYEQKLGYDEPNKNNTKTVVENYNKPREVVNSQELTEGMKIVAKDGGKPSKDVQQKDNGER